MTYLKALPDITEDNRPFWNGLQRHEFLVPKCNNCGDYNWAPSIACRTCFSRDLAWTKVSGDGTVFSYTIVRRGPGVWQEEVPYVVAMVELVEQPRPIILMGNLVDYDESTLAIGMPVRITYEDIPEEDVTLWKFVPR